MTTGTRKTTSQRSDEIIRAILRIIGERGVTSLSTSALAEEVGVTTGALFRHFPSRDAMLQGAADFALQEIAQTFPGDDLPPLERIIQLARNRITLLRANPGLAWMLMSEQAYLTLPAESLAGLRKMVQRSRKFMLEALRQAAEQGDIRDDIEPEAMLVPLMGTIHALIGGPGMHRSGKRPDPDRILAALLKMLAPLPQHTQ
jgi:AcrR family transcriptional regulator